jgi:predicted Zn-dependent protease
MNRQLLPSLAALIMVAGCAANPATGGNNFSLISAAHEREIGNQTANEALQQYGLYQPESRVTGYVNGLCRKAWAVTEMAAEPVQCIFLNSEEFNAWATPGYINVYRGLLPYMQSEAQLVSVIGHEAGHVTAKHVGSRMTAGVVGGVLGALAGAYIGSQTNNGAGQAANVLIGAGMGAGLAAYSRSQETQADELGQRYMERMGYDKRESAGMVVSMLRHEEYQKEMARLFNGGVAVREGTLGGLFASHPATPGRADHAAKVAGGWPDGGLKLPAGIMPATTANDPQGRTRFHQMIEGLTYGPQRKFGIASREMLTFPSSRVALQFPSGMLFEFAGYNEAKKATLWQGVHAESLVEARVLVVPLKAGMNVGFVLKDSLGFTGELQRLELKAANKPQYAEAYTGLAAANGKPARLVAFALPGTEDLVVVNYIFRDAAQRDREQAALVASLQTSKFYSEDAANRLQPLEIRTFQAAVGDSVARRAAQLPQGALREEWFRALNGLASDEDLRPGTWYKRVADINS